MKKPLANPIDPQKSDDASLFRTTVGEVNILAKQNRVKPYVSPQKLYVHPDKHASTIPDNLSDFTPNNIPDEYTQNGISRLSLRKLKRGNWPIQDTLDLHGNHRDAARKLLQEFLHSATNNKIRCVLVIHGKGINSQGGEAVLRKLTRHWLIQHPKVLGYCNALPKQGGGGAVLILLKSKA